MEKSHGSAIAKIATCESDTLAALKSAIKAIGDAMAVLADTSTTPGEVGMETEEVHAGEAVGTTPITRPQPASDIAGPQHAVEMAASGEDAAAVEAIVTVEVRVQPSDRSMAAEFTAERSATTIEVGTVASSELAGALFAYSLLFAVGMTPTSTSSSASEDKEVTTSSPAETPPITKLSSYPVIPRSELTLLEQLGAGTFGAVFKGIWLPPTPALPNGVVNKEPSIDTTLRSNPITVALKKVFMLEKEVDILSQIRHRNIIQFFGISHANPDFYIVTEYAETGSLYDYLHNAKAEMSCERILKWATQIARGVAYLHYDAPSSIIHRDLKSKNVVIGKNYECKLCDFGTSKDLTHSWTAPTWGGTAAWMSPEIISQREGITTATDVWSFGVLLWEIFTRELPYEGLTEFKIYSIISQHGVKLVIPDRCPEHLANLLRDCWRTSPKERVDMKEVMGCLEHMRGDREVRRECAHFVKQKSEWKGQIKDQLTELDAIKLDLARQMEELARREQALRRRESSHRNFLNMIDYVGFDRVDEWNEDCVCEWIQKIAASAGVDEIITTDVIDRMVSSVFAHEIKGSRLLQMTEKDFENLGMESPTIRKFISHKIDGLRAMNEAGKMQTVVSEFPSLQVSAMIGDQAQKPHADKSKSPYPYSIALHVGLYTRESRSSLSDANATGATTNTRLRFKVFLDSDWEELATDSAPSEIHDSSTVIRDVCFSMVGADKTVVLLETVRCMCPPFGYLEWVDADESNLPVTLTCSVTYTDQVISPRNTRINVEIGSVRESRTLCNKLVPLKIRPIITSSSLTRISSAHHTMESPEPSGFSSLQGVWRRRAGSYGSEDPRLSADRKAAVAKCASPNVSISPKPLLWADIAALSRKPPLIVPSLHSRGSRSIGGAPSELAASRILEHQPLPKVESAQAWPLSTSPKRETNTWLKPSGSPVRLQSPRRLLLIPGKNTDSGVGRPLEPGQGHQMGVFARGGNRRKSETEVLDVEGRLNADQPKVADGHALFFVEEDSPPTNDDLDAEAHAPGMDGRHSVSQPTEKVREVPNRCCGSGCRQRERTRTAPAQEDNSAVGAEDEDNKSGETDDLKPKASQRRRRSKRQSLKAPIDEGDPLDEKSVVNSNDVNTAGAKDAMRHSAASRGIYGGYNKWKWKA